MGGNPNTNTPPPTDQGDIGPIWYPFDLARKRVQEGGWSHQVTQRELPPSTDHVGVIIVLTILLPVPIDNQIAGWNLDRLPADWISVRRRWDLYHRIRVLLLLVALTLLILSALLSPQE